MNCDWVQKHLHSYLCNELTPEKRKKVSEHLSNCPRCLQELALWEDLHTTLSTVEMSNPPIGFTTDVMSRIYTQQQTQQPISLRNLFEQPALASVAAAAVFALFIGPLIDGRVLLEEVHVAATKFFNSFSMEDSSMFRTVVNISGHLGESIISIFFGR